MTTPKSVPITPFFGGFVLETLTVGMYGESRNAIREYIQNGFDSIGHAIDLKIIRPGQGLIQIIMAEDKDSLTIRDNGAGIPVRNAAETLARVGASSKDHTTDAGFRGIGRLAGIVFSDRVTFTTKARGEVEQTKVVFDAAKMREGMKPEKGSTVSAEELLRDCVEATVETVQGRGDHFFEVKLEGFDNPPEECKQYKLMEDFVSQVAPVPYSSKFPFRKELAAAEKECRLPTEEVKIEIKDGRNAPVQITKPYQDKYKIGTVWVELSDHEIHISPDQNWWVWIGKKDESGAYADARVSGLRVRMKNIQIDGTEFVREIFQSQAPSFIRFQDWYVGEIFVRPSFLVPNARRDGFEETKQWKRMRRDLGTLVKKLGRESYRVSNKGQLAVEALERKVTEKRDEIGSLRETNFNNVDRTISFSAGITALQKLVARASKEADLPTSATLQALNSELTDIKAEAVSHLGVLPASIDEEKVQQEARDELLKELITLFETELPSNCAVAVRNLLRKEYGLKNRGS
jgi:Histidine kinase-, DNA gyrase B-, and HSP90-like ATPase